MRKSNLKLWKQDVEAMSVMNKKIDELYNLIDAKDQIIQQLTIEITKLKKIHNKAIEYIKNKKQFQKGCDIYQIIDWEYVLELLGDKE